MKPLLSGFSKWIPPKTARWMRCIFALLLITIGVIAVPDQRAAAAAYGIRFVSAPSLLSTASKFSTSVELYSTATGLRVFHNGVTVNLHLYRMISGTPTLIMANYASGVTFFGALTFSDLNIDTTGTNFYFLATATGYDYLPSSAFDVEVAFVWVSPSPLDKTTASHFPETVEVRIGALDGPIDTLATGYPIDLALRQGVSIIDPNFASVIIDEGVALFVGNQINTAGTNYKYSISIPGITNIISFISDTFDVHDSGIRIEPDPPNVQVSTDFDISALIRDLETDAVDTYASGLIVHIGLKHGSTVITNDFASATTLLGVATFSNLQIATPGVGYYFFFSITNNPSLITWNSDEFAVVDPPSLIATLTIQGRPAPPSAKLVLPIDVIWTPTGGGSSSSTTTTTDFHGRLLLNNLTPNFYRVWVKADNTLASVHPIVSVTSGTTTTTIPELRGGDANDSNTVTIADFSILAAAFGKSNGQVGYNASADFNGDSSVTIADFSILASNFGQSGAEP